MTALYELYRDASEDTGVQVSYRSTFLKAYNEGRLIVRPSFAGFSGFLLFNEAKDPDTGKLFFIERMLWVRPTFRNGRVSARLLRDWEELARKRGNVTLCAGASLPNPENARAAYERAGFRTTFSFQKEITNV